MWKALNVFIDQIRRLYSDWDIRVMVLLSLLLQVLLQLLGNRQKFSPSVWLRVIVWCSYVSVDSIAILALGTISTKLGRIDDLSHLDGETKLNALWAPCLLLMLGGPDSITAYSVEDNQLWLRHFVVFLGQTAVAGYVCFLTWASDCLSYLSMLLLVAGVIKYGERVWVLWQVSFDKLRNEQYLHGLNKVVVGTRNEYNLDHWEKGAFDDNTELTCRVYTTFEIFKHIFLNQKLSRHAIVTTREKFNQLTPQKVFKIIEIELGFMYDLLHTKAKTTYTCWGLFRRLMTSTISCTVLAVFSWFVNKKLTTSDVDYPRIDVGVTFVLLAINISSEIYWVFMLLASDWAQVVWFGKEGSCCYKYRKYVVRNTILQLCKQPRWTKSASQLSFFSLFVNVDKRAWLCDVLLKLLKLHEKVGPYYHTQQQEITDYTQDQIFFIIKGIPDETGVLRSHKLLLEYVCQGGAPLHLCNELIMEKYELYEIIIIWHIATELCNYYDYTSSSLPPYYLRSDDDGDDGIMKARKTTMLLSRYMFYILVRYPLMLQTVNVYSKLMLVCPDDLRTFWRLDDPGIVLAQSDVKKLIMTFDCDEIINKFEGRRPPLWITACWLAKKLVMIDGRNTMSNTWRFLLNSWFAHLIYAAYNCREEYHTQQLRRGGELLTHVWMLLVHCGLTDHLKS